MTETARAQRNTVLTAGFANPLNLPANAEASSHIKVYGDDVLLTLSTDYTLSGVDDLDDLDGITGVNVTIDAAVILADLYDTYTVEHDPPLDQDGDLSAGGRFGAAFEDAVDALARRLQAIGAKVARSLRLPTDVSEEDVDIALPLPDPGMALKWNEDGTALINSTSDPDLGDFDIDAVAGLVEDVVEASLLSTINTSVALADADRIAAAASAAAALVSENNAETAETNAETAQAAAVMAQLAAEAAAGANSTMQAQIMAASSAAMADGDSVGMVDLSAGGPPYTLIRRTWTEIKAFLKTYFDTLYSAVGHTHSFSSLTSKPTTLSGYNITDAIQADKSAGSVDTYAFCFTTTGGNDDFGDTRAGSQLRPCNSDDVPATGSTLSGTWRCMGNTVAGSGDQSVTLWYRRV